MGNNELYKNAQEAIAALFGDTSVSQRQAKENLNSLMGDLEVMLDTLKEEDDENGKA